MTDIVTRLRGAHEQSAKYPRLLLSEIEALVEAADEIEKLRAQLKLLMSELMFISTNLNSAEAKYMMSYYRNMMEVADDF